MGHLQYMSPKQRHKFLAEKHEAGLRARRGKGVSYLSDLEFKKLELKDTLKATGERLNLVKFSQLNKESVQDIKPELSADLYLALSRA